MDRLGALTDRELGRLLSEFLLVIQETEQALVLMPGVPNVDVDTFMDDVLLIMHEQAQRQRAIEEQSRHRRAATGGA